MVDKIDSEKLQYKNKTGDFTPAEKKDLDLNRKIKPVLKKYLIDKQTKKAQETSIEQKKDKDLQLSRDDVIRAASRLSMKAFLDIKVWQKLAPRVSMNWIQKGNATKELQQEMQGDIAGFSTYLVREFYQYEKLKYDTKKGYLNPLSENNILFFWEKFNIDLALLIEADKKRIMAGNAGIIIADKLPPINKLSN